MNLLYQGLVLVHVVIGFASLVVFWLPLMVKKGGRWHKQAGMAFAIMMYVVSITAFVVSVMLLIDPDIRVATPASFQIASPRARNQR